MPVGFGVAVRESIELKTPNGLPGLLSPSLAKKQSFGLSQSNLGKKLRSKKEIHDIIECNSSNFNTVVNYGDNQISDILNGEGGQKNQKTYLNQLYNQDIAPQDSQKTLFYYLKTLVIHRLTQAFEIIIVLLSFVGIIFSFIMYYDFIPGFSDTEARQTVTLITLITIVTAFLETQTRIKWLKQKKQKQNSAKDEYISFLIEVLLLLPSPNNFITGEFSIQDQLGNQTFFNYDEIFTVFVLGRVIYVYKFIIHSQLYYGSRPDRLSRLYTVKFGTFNSFKFLINEKPLLIVIFMFSLNLFFLPMLLLLIEGKVNPGLSTFMACLHYTIVTQVTVGYGNILVRTFLGRIISVSFILIGVTSTSLLLIFFMRLMEQTSQQEEAHLLLSSLQKRQQITKARVLRIQTEYLYSKIRCPPEQKHKYEQKLRQFRFDNRRNILFQREEPANVKRMMLSNFASVIQMINSLKEKQSILAKIVEFVIKTNNHAMPDKIVQEDSMGEDEFERLFHDKKRKLTGSKLKKKNELMIDNNSSLMLEKLGRNIRNTIISKPIVFQK